MNAQAAEEKATILLVEDDAEMAWMTRSLLEREGFSVVVAQSGEEALDMLGVGEAARPEPLVRSDLILLDVLMEGLGGYQVCQRLKQDERLGYIPIIMVTVLDSSAEKVKGLRYGADDYIAKPFKSEELLARIEALLRVKRLYDELKQMEEELAHTAAHDPLTGALNRLGFFTLAEQQLKMADRAKTKLMLFFADLDGLKQINDTLGHSEGDQALIEAAEVLKETFRQSDIIARIGGDEFVVMAVETDEAGPEILTDRLRKNLEARNAEAGRRYKLSLSVGLARYDPERPCSIDELLAQADRAMYEQKRG